VPSDDIGGNKWKKISDILVKEHAIYDANGPNKHSSTERNPKLTQFRAGISLANITNA
jgi:hypothetical protein